MGLGATFFILGVPPVTIAAFGSLGFLGVVGRVYIARIVGVPGLVQWFQFYCMVHQLLQGHHFGNTSQHVLKWNWRDCFDVHFLLENFGADFPACSAQFAKLGIEFLCITRVHQLFQQGVVGA